MPEIQSAVRRCSEDPRLRPFLSSHFDAQSYIRNILKEGKSEESFLEISSAIHEVNSEIQEYISAHKDSLMSGMQDVTVLSHKYQNLAMISKTMKKNLDRLKKEVFFVMICTFFQAFH